MALSLPSNSAVVVSSLQFLPFPLRSILRITPIAMDSTFRCLHDQPIRLPRHLTVVAPLLAQSCRRTFNLFWYRASMPSEHAHNSRVAVFFESNCGKRVPCPVFYYNCTGTETTCWTNVKAKQMLLRITICSHAYHASFICSLIHYHAIYLCSRTTKHYVYRTARAMT